jgi:hypothetical protein
MKIQHTAEGAMQLDHFDYLHLDKDNNFYCRSFSYGIIANIHHKWYSLLLTDQKGKEEGNRDESNICESSYYKFHNNLQGIKPSDKPLVFCQSYSGASPIIIDTVKDCLIPPGELLSPEFSFSPIESAQNAMRSFHIIKDHPESEAYEGLKSSHDAAVARFRMFLAKKFSEFPGEYRYFKPISQSHLPASLKHYSIMGNNGK